MAVREIIQVEQKVSILKGIPLSLQHLFAMFGASVLVPILFNSFAGKTVVDPSLVLLMNGIGTLIYIFVTKGKAPAFLGSSFAFLAPTAAVIAAAVAHVPIAQNGDLVRVGQRAYEGIFPKVFKAHGDSLPLSSGLGEPRPWFANAAPKRQSPRRWLPRPIPFL